MARCFECNKPMKVFSTNAHSVVVCGCGAIVWYSSNHLRPEISAHEYRHFIRATLAVRSGKRIEDVPQRVRLEGSTLKAAIKASEGLD